MNVITFASSKGGTGKSTLLMGVGVAAVEAGERVYLIDTDPQHSLMDWAERRKIEAPHVDQARPMELESALPGLERAGYTLALIDSLGADVGGTAAAVKLSALTVVVVRPFLLDILGIKPTLDMLKRLELPYSVVVNAVPPRSTMRLADAAAAFTAEIAPPVTSRMAHPDAVIRGLGVTEYEPNGAAAAEVRALWAYLKDRTVGVKPRSRLSVVTS